MGSTTRRVDQYPNAPLTEVACEIRFPGEIAVESCRDRFWDRIRDAYPTIKVPQAKAGSAPALQHYRYSTAPSGGRNVAVAINSLALSEERYTTHKPFLAEFKRLHSVFSKCYPKIEKLNRIGWRYMNLIPYVREEGNVPLARFIKLTLPMPASLPGQIRNVQLSLEVPISKGLAIIKLATVHDTRDTQREALLLDLDFSFERPNMRMSEAPSLMAEAHKRNRQVFEDLITDQYRSYLRGEAI